VPIVCQIEVSLQKALTRVAGDASERDQNQAENKWKYRHYKYERTHDEAHESSAGSTQVRVGAKPGS
jgi:hypothetical protein